MSVSRTGKAWQVRVERDGELHGKYFPDSVHGKSKGQLQARAHEAYLLATLPPAKRRPVPVPGKGTVARKVCSDGRGGTYNAFVATIRVAPGKGAATKASIDKHGKAGAMRIINQWLLAKRAEQKANFHL